MEGGERYRMEEGRERGEGARMNGWKEGGRGRRVERELGWMYGGREGGGRGI